eukprot:TRINITY_DN33055_c0_g1_i1.p2 TRINITY_DN33055_c0_g1~~TRINITY_DN33055_c0_g1_i1.p2  ORF type:complete len:270 (-),score=39.82 TRINITY_DN33055_c0_g1_i1:160-969(-)
MSCSDLQTQATSSVAVGMFLVYGTLFSYLPQFRKFLTRRTSEGVSHITCFFTCSMNTCLVINATVLQWNAISCCQHASAWLCNVGLLSLQVIYMNCFCNLLVYSQWWLFFKCPDDKARRELFVGRTMLLCFAAFAMVLAAVAAILFRVAGVGSRALNIYATILGIIAAIVVTIQLLPQIWATFKLKSAGSYSIAMLAMQTPGSFAVVVFQVRPEPTPLLCNNAAVSAEHRGIHTHVIPHCRGQAHTHAMCQSPHPGMQQYPHPCYATPR